MKSVSRFILIKVGKCLEVLEVKAYPLVSDQIKAFITKAHLKGREGWSIISEDTGCAVNIKTYPTIKDAQDDWKIIEKRCTYLLENPRIKEGYEEKKKLFRVQGFGLLGIYAAFVLLQVLIALHVL
jgi:hypothetical protein